MIHLLLAAAAAASPVPTTDPAVQDDPPPGAPQDLSTQAVTGASPVPPGIAAQEQAAPPLGSSTILTGQSVGPDGRLIYEAAFFSRYSPATALDIVQRLPAFTIEQVDGEVRGFGGAAGNVVINGQRPIAKTDTIETILARIPASQVVRVEVGRGALFASEFSAKAQVANIIVSGGGGIAGTATGTLRRGYDGKFVPDASVSALLKRGRSTFNVSMGLENEQSNEEGSDTLTEYYTGALIEFRRKINVIDNPNGYLSASWAYDDGDNRTAHLNGRFAVNPFRLTQFNQVTPATGPARDDRLFQRYNLTNYEIGGDVTRPFAGGGLKLIALATRRSRANSDLSLLRVDGTTINGFAQTLDDRREETVVRSVWNRSDLAGWAVEVGAEGALNKLVSDVNLFSIAPGGGRVRIDLPVDQATVEEYRGEAFVNAGRALTPTLRLNAGLTVETSRLTVSGDTSAERSLTFLKPKMTLDWKAPGDWRVQASLTRTVAQLQFEDFISAAELSNERINGGNANLLPQRAWEASSVFEHGILGNGLFRFELGYQKVSLVQDRIPTPEGFDAPGNLGDGDVLIVRGSLDTPLDSIGLKGGRLTTKGSFVDTNVQDPYTLSDRPFSGNNLWTYEVQLRQDRGKVAWGLTLYGNSGGAFYRLNEIDRSFRDNPYAIAFVEYRPTRATTVTLGVENLFDVRGYRERIFYAPNRTNPAPFARELRERSQHLLPYLTFKRNFG